MATSQTILKSKPKGKNSKVKNYKNIHIEGKMKNNKKSRQQVRTTNDKRKI